MLSLRNKTIEPDQRRGQGLVETALLLPLLLIFLFGVAEVGFAMYN